MACRSAPDSTNGLVCLNIATHCRQDSNLQAYSAGPTTGLCLPIPSLRVIGVMTSDSDVESITLITIVKHTRRSRYSDSCCCFRCLDGLVNALEYGVVYPLLGYDLLEHKDQHPRVYTYLAVYRFRPNLTIC